MYKSTVNPHQHIQSRFWKHFVASLVLFALVGYVMTQIPYFGVRTLIAIEFAPDVQIFHALVANTHNLQQNTYIDFFFILAYTALFYFSGRVVYDLLQFATQKLLFLLFLPLLFDVIENLLLLQMLDKAPEDYFSFCLFYYAVRLKWLFAIPGTIVVLLVVFYHLYALLDRIYALFKKSE